MPKFNNEEITQESILLTRQHFADIRQDCIDEVLNGTVKLPSHTLQADYSARCRQRAEDDLAGINDHSLTFLQRAYWIQTGKSIALLP